jgi:hypothetical protein
MIKLITRFYSKIRFKKVKMRHTLNEQSDSDSDSYSEYGTLNIFVKTFFNKNFA